MTKKIICLVILLIFITSCTSVTVIEEPHQLKSIKDNINTILTKEKTPESIDELVKTFNEYIKADKEAYNIRNRNEYFLMKSDEKGNMGKNRGVLLIHGLGASPGEIKELGEFLNSKGFTVLGVRVSGHGSTLGALEASKWQEWYDSVKFSYDMLNYLSDEIYVVGMSAGASLGFLLVEKEAEKETKEIDNIKGIKGIDNIRGIVSIGAPVFMLDHKFKYISILKYFRRYSERNLTEEEKAVYNEALPTRTIEQLKFLIEEEKQILPQITTPVLIIQAANDTRVNPKSAEYIYSHVGSKDKKIKWIDDNKHVIISGKYQQEIFDDIFVFVSS